MRPCGAESLLALAIITLSKQSYKRHTHTHLQPSRGTADVRTRSTAWPGQPPFDRLNKELVGCAAGTISPQIPSPPHEHFTRSQIHDMLVNLARELLIDIVLT
ncbi:hypothetical protein J6590_033676 [Homalodisca vitripennis]|nr:hypothetical protein J6590_033676 [Homalodisca vitripennis]